MPVIQDSENNEEATTLDIPNNTKTRIDFVSRERHTVIQSLAQQSKKQDKVPDSTLEPAKSLYQRLDLLLQ